MKKHNRIIFLILAVLMTAFCFSACGQNVIPENKTAEMYDISVFDDAYKTLTEEKLPADEAVEKYDIMLAEAASAKSFADAVANGDIAFDGISPTIVDNCVEYTVSATDKKLLEVEREYFTDDEYKEKFIEKQGQSYADERLAIPDVRYYDNMDKSPLDFDKFDELSEQIYTLCDDESNAKFVRYLYMYADSEESFNREKLKYIHIENTLDVKNETKVKAYQDATVLFGEKENDYLKLNQTLLASPCLEYLIEKNTISAEYVDYCNGRTVLSDEAIALKSKAASLAADYYTLYAKALEDSEHYDDYAAEGVDLLVEIVKLRRSVGDLLDSGESYCEYIYKAKYNRDYTPADTKILCAAVKEKMVPILNYSKSDFKKSGTPYADAFNTFTPNDEQLISAVKKTFDIWDEFENSYEYMTKYGMYDISVNDAKSEMAYTYSIRKNEAYLFFMPYGYYEDISGIVHEFGHFNECVVRDKETNEIGTTNIDLCEIHSQALELLMTEYYPEMYNTENAPLGDLTSKKTLNDKLSDICSCACISEFEDYLYNCDDADLTAEKVNAKFNELREEYNLGPMPLFRISHIFNLECYCISYSTSALVSFEIFTEPIRDEAVQKYISLVEYGCGKGFSEVLEKTGLDSPFEAETITKLAEKLSEYFGIEETNE